jgi:hypothetical protein
MSAARITARVTAAASYVDAIGDAVEAGKEIRRFRWENAHLLALEAKAMIELLSSDKSVVFRQARLGHWRRRYRRFAAKAYALDHVTAWRAGLTGATP